MSVGLRSTGFFARWEFSNQWENPLIDLIQMAFRLYTFLILARVILSWVNHDVTNPVINWVYRLTEPVMAPFRALIPAFGGIDFTPILVLLVLNFIESLLLGLLQNLSLS